MLATMPKKEKAKADYVDVFSRMRLPVVEKLDALADDQHRTRSSMVAWIVEKFIEVEYPKLAEKTKGSR